MTARSFLPPSTPSLTRPLQILTLSNVPADPKLGSGVVIHEYCNGLRRLGHHVVLLQPEQYEPCHHRLQLGRRYRQALGMLLHALRSRPKRFDLIEFYGGEAWLATALLAMLPHEHRPVIVQHSNGPEPRYATLDKPARWYQTNQGSLMRLAFTRADYVVTVSEYDRQWLMRENILQPYRIVAINNALTDEFLEMRPARPRERCLGFAGSWLTRRGTAQAATALTAFLRAHSNWRLKVIGPGPSFHSAKVFPPDIRSQITTIPFVAQKARLRDELEEVSIYIWPSLGESFGILLAEAMASGCCCIATPVGFGADLRHNIEAYIVEPGSSAQLEEAMESLAANDAVRDAIATRGQERVRTLNWADSVRTLESTYLACITRRNSEQ